MYPRRDATVDASLPVLSNYWVPKPRDADEEGYGLNFRDVWALSGVSVADAEHILRWERAAAEWVSEQASDEAQFEALARFAESCNPDDEPEESPTGADLPAELRDSSHWLWGLELGVSGLSHVMAATGFFPVASCRSHSGPTWSPEPVVLFTADEQRLRRFQPLVAETGCGLELDATRGETLLVVCAPSIVEIMDLAARLFDSRAEFRSLPKSARKRSSAPREAPPPTLF